MGDDLVKEGYLMKRLNQKKWKQCYYRLDITDVTTATLSHFEQKTMLRPRDEEGNEAIDRIAQGERQIIPLRTIDSLDYDDGGNVFTLHLSTGGHVTLRARNPGEAGEWADLLKLGFDRLKNQQNGVGRSSRTGTNPALTKSNSSHVVGVGQTGANQKMQNNYAHFRSGQVDLLTLGRKKGKGKKKKGSKSRMKELEEQARRAEEEEKRQEEEEEMMYNIPPPPKSKKQNRGFETVKENLVFKPPPPQETQDETPAPVRKKRSGGSTVLKKHKAAEEKEGVQGRNAVLPVLIVSEEEKKAQSGNTKSEEIEKMLFDTLMRSSSLASVLLKELDEAAVHRMVKDMYRVVVPTGKRLVTQGEAGNQFYIVESGRCDVLMKSTFTDESLNLIEGQESKIGGGGPGSYFAQMALLYEHPSTVTVDAANDCVLWALSRKQFHEIRKESAERQQQIRIQKIHSIDMFSKVVNDEQIVALADAMEEKQFKKGEIILDKGSAVESIYFLVDGRIGLYSTNESDPETILAENAAYGALALIEPFDATHTLKAMDKIVKVLCLPINELGDIVGDMTENLRQRFEEDPAFKKTIMANFGLDVEEEEEEEITPELAVQKTIAAIREGSYTTGTMGTGTMVLSKLGSDARTTMERGTEGPLVAIDKDWIEAPPIIPDIKFSNLKPIKILGSGNFGHVHLVKNSDMGLKVQTEGSSGTAPKYFALKVLSREFIVSNGWEQMAENEKCAMEELSYFSNSPFIIKLYHSFTDSRNIYFLLELCDGGDLYKFVKRKKAQRLKEEDMKFYVAGVVKGLEAMHASTIIYRDLKPENLMLDNKGYLKIGDFGLAKKTLRTFTVCGTPDYMAPETILSKGHDKAVDWWAVGVLIYEIGTASTPFFGQEPMDIYEDILNHEVLKLPTGITAGVEISANCFDIMDSLMQSKKTKRLGSTKEGAQGVINHAWFHGFKWKEYEARTLKAPYKKKIGAYKDPGNYDPEFDNEIEDESNWDPCVNTYLEDTPVFPF